METQIPRTAIQTSYSLSFSAFAYTFTDANTDDNTFVALVVPYAFRCCRISHTRYYYDAFTTHSARMETNTGL